MIKVGKFVNTHGIKGEIRIISNFSRKDLIFKKDKEIIINNQTFVILSHRVHKNYDMLVLEGIDDINKIEHLKGNNVYVEDLNVDFLLEDLLNYKVMLDQKEYNITEVIENKKYKILRLSDNKMIPFIDHFIERIDNDKKIIYVRVGIGL